MEYFKYLIAGLIIFTGLIASLAIATAIRRSSRYKSFESELLVDHLHDALNTKKWDKLHKKNTSIYFYKKLMDYATESALSRIDKKYRYDNNGQYSDVAKKVIQEEQINIGIVFTDGKEGLNERYINFITDYRPWYLVGDFSKTIIEYMTFCMNPGAFKKAEPATNTSDSVEVRQFENEQQKKIPVNNTADIQSDYFDEVQEDDVEDIYDDSLIYFSETTVVDKDITDVLVGYTEKLAKKRFDKNGMICYKDGVRTSAFSEECGNIYDRLSKLFFDKRLFNSDFINWVKSDFPDYDISRFDELIAPYIRYVKANG